MKFAIILSIVVIGLTIDLFVLRYLLRSIRSERSNRLVDGIVEPPPAPTEVLNQCTRAELLANECVDDCDAKARLAQLDAMHLRRKLHQPPEAAE